MSTIFYLISLGFLGASFLQPDPTLKALIGLHTGITLCVGLLVDIKTQLKGK